MARTKPSTPKDTSPTPAAAEPIEPLTVSALVPDTDNANRGTERGGGLLEQTIRYKGFGRSILIDKDKKVIAGNKTLQAAVDAGMVRLRIVQTDGNEVIAVQRTDVSLDSKQGRELAIADNAIALRSILTVKSSPGKPRNTTSNWRQWASRPKNCRICWQRRRKMKPSRS